MTESSPQTDSDQPRVCTACGAPMVHLGIIRRFQQRSSSVYRCYQCNNVVVEHGDS